jgi:hypothetical protein
MHRVSDTRVYKTQAGVIFRVVENEGHLSVETLKDAGWESAPIGMIGLRVAPTTLELTARQVLRLPV